MDSLGQTIKEHLAQAENKASTLKKPGDLESLPIECKNCMDTKTVRVGVEMDSPLFGHALPCPDCLAPRATFDTFQAVTGSGQALALAKDYAAGKLTTPWLLLVGTFGAGKTHLAHAILHEHQRRLQMVLMTFVPSLMDQLRGSYSADESSDHNEILARYQRDHLVILDDIGDSGNVTPWVREQILLILNNRYEGSKPTVMTTNNNMEQIATLFGGRIASRMWDTTNTSVGILDCKDYRTGKVW